MCKLDVAPSPFIFSCVHSHQRKKGITLQHEHFSHHSENVSHPNFKSKIRCSSYVCPRSSCHIYGQNISTEYQCIYYIVSYYKNLLQIQNGLNSGMYFILSQTVDRGFHTSTRNLHQRTPHLLSSRT
jgi:hypothetical protein